MRTVKAPQSHSSAFEKDRETALGSIAAGRVDSAEGVAHGRRGGERDDAFGEQQLTSPPCAIRSTLKKKKLRWETKVEGENGSDGNILTLSCTG